MTILTGIRSIYEHLKFPRGDFSDLFPSIKHQALLFDRIGFIGLDANINDLGFGINENNLGEILWLKENNILYNIDHPKRPSEEEGGAEFLKYLSSIGMDDDYWGFFLPKLKQNSKNIPLFTQKSKELRHRTDKKIKFLLDNISETNNLILRKEIEEFIREGDNLIKFVGNSFIENESIIARYLCQKTIYYDKVDAISLIPYYGFTKTPSSQMSEIARVILSNLPLPDETTPWEQIIDFRNDPKNQAALLSLRRWIRKISIENLSVTEIEEELKWLSNEFQTYMNLHRIKTNTNTIEIWVKTPLEVLENLIKLKFSKLVDPFFAIKKRRISLMEAELQAPGREVAYILNAKYQFFNE